MSAAVTLRRAAALIRERAEKAALSGDGEPWFAADELHGLIGAGSRNTADAEHIASWHPAVALAVADWLESEAGALEAMAKFSAVATTQVREFDIRGAAIAVSKGEDGSIGISADTSRQALAVARAYLGSES